MYVGKKGAVIMSKYKDFEQCKQLADSGDAKAQVHLGSMYDFGEGVPLNNAEAMKWYMLAAEQGDITI